MKKTLLASLGLTLMLSTSAGATFAAEADSSPVAKDAKISSLLEYHEQEPNDSFEQANYYFITDAVIGTLGEKVQGAFENYDVYKIMVSRSNEVLFTIQGDIFSDSWMELTLYDSNGNRIKRSKNGQYSLDADLEKGKDYYLTVTALGLEAGKHVFDYRLSSEVIR
ncbi:MULTISPECIES: hypothetical protein [Paenibacillus]|uniref:hypothetical protein n=1 Tax=Paenibacillus TaxID=44249 RepID=UPI0005CF2BDA|nr:MULTISPECIES: hypothetical protein [Paenibacillus]KAF6582066.1 hypothetical protein G9G57_19135 [Paenibacillus sp. EKM211P]KJD41099.1 hypothetical protein QD46_03545 [Paenibacillus polymyxa]MDN4086114.1 hypothetical protein [Paenibacillus polymyxa]MDN4087111.1 hypothetical protein [Paenibacillus polymyxa]MDN4108733.1 hypothetical protein [Paenibacillus polymyxa]